MLKRLSGAYPARSPSAGDPYRAFSHSQDPKRTPLGTRDRGAVSLAGHLQSVDSEIVAGSSTCWRSTTVMFGARRWWTCEACPQVLLERFGCPAVSPSEPFEDGLALLRVAEKRGLEGWLASAAMPPSLRRVPRTGTG